MPVESYILNPMLDPFRNMLKEVEENALSGEDYDKMKAALDRMEELGQTHSDIMAFNAALATENLFAIFSDHYGKLLANAAKQSSQSGDYDDSTLLKQSIDALKNAISELQRSYEAAKTEANAKSNNKNIDQSVEVAVLNDPTLIIQSIQDLINLGEQEGMTLPKFLRLQMEKGLDKAMEGTAVLKNGLQFSLDGSFASANNPIEIKKDEEKLEAFNFLAEKSKFGVPNTKELNYLHEDIDYKYAKQLAAWNEITDRWDDLLFSLSYWSLSYTSLAPTIEPWSMSKNPKAATIRTQKTNPGIFQQRLRLFTKYFDMEFMDIFKHETFIWALEKNHIGYSQEYLTFLIEKVYPQYKPFNDLPSEVIQERLSFYQNSKEGNPESHVPGERFAGFYDSYFGNGRFLEKFGQIEKSKSSAAIWDLSNFSYSK